MRAMHAIYENGRVTFSFMYPDYDGPVGVLVVFPDQEYEPEDADLGEPERELVLTGAPRRSRIPCSG